MSKFLTGILLAILVLLLAVPVAAQVADPDSISLNSVRIYQNLVETGDWLIVIEHEVMYASEPVEEPDDLFLVALVVGGHVQASRGVVDYQHHVGSIYLTAERVADLSLTWGGAYVVRVMGNPVFFTPTEGVNMASMALSGGHWVTGSQTQSRQYLGDRVIVLAKILQTSWGIELVTSNDLLNSVGRSQFLRAIPGLDGICPQIFQVAVGYPDVPGGPGSPDYADELIARRSARLTASLNDLGLWVTGRPNLGTFIGGLGLMILFFILAGRIFVATGSVPGAIAVSLPFIIGGNLLGLLPLAYTFAAAFLAALAFAVVFIIGRL